MNKFKIPENAALRVTPSEDGGVSILVRFPGKTIELIFGIDVALALSEEINRVTEIVCTGGRDD